MTTLLIEPPPELPAELEASVDSEERRLTRERSKRGLLPVLLFFGMTPLLPWLNVISVPMLIATYMSVAVVAMTAWVNWRVCPVPLWIFLTGNLFLAIMFSRLIGPFILTPLMIAAILLAITPIPWVN